MVPALRTRLVLTRLDCIVHALEADRTDSRPASTRRTFMRATGLQTLVLLAKHARRVLHVRDLPLPTLHLFCKEFGVVIRIVLQLRDNRFGLGCADGQACQLRTQPTIRNPARSVHEQRACDGGAHQVDPMSHSPPPFTEHATATGHAMPPGQKKTRPGGNGRVCGNAERLGRVDETRTAETWQPEDCHVPRIRQLARSNCIRSDCCSVVCTGSDSRARNSSS